MRLKLLVICPLALLIFIISSCSDDPVTPGMVNVSGQVGYDFGYLHDAKVEIDGKITTTDGEGKFVIPNVTVPYDLKVMTSNSLDVMIIKGLSVSEPYVNFEPGYIQTTSKQGAQIISTLDSMPGSNQKTFSVFIPDEGEPQVLSYYFGGVAQNTIRNEIYWIGGPVIKGKLIVLVYTVIGNRIQKFDKYYEKESITVHDNSSDSLYLGSPSAYPVTGSVSGTVDNYHGTPSHIQMKLKFKNSLTQYSLDQVFGAFVFAFAIPGNIPEPFDIVVEAKEGNQYGRKVIQPNTYDNVIKQYRPVDLISPEEYDSVSFNRTPFIWSSNEAGSDLYELEINNYTGVYRRIRVIGSSPSTVVSDLSQIGYSHLGGGVTYQWKVNKIFGLSDINEFMKGNYRNANGFQGYSHSDYRLARIY